MDDPYPPADTRTEFHTEFHIEIRIDIRAADRRDVPQMAAIERRAFSDAWPESAFVSLLDSAVARVSVAEDDGVILGYSVVMLVADEGELANIAVAEHARRRGVGRRLLDALLAAAAAEGVKSMYLEVRESNAAARTLYAAYGFAPMGRRRGYYRSPDEDALLLIWRAPVGDRQP